MEKKATTRDSSESKGTFVMQLRNYMEVIVFGEVDKVVKGYDMCKCERCINDIAAYALNNLPPKYSVSNEIYSRLNMLHSQFKVDVMTKLVEGTELVKNNPRH